MSDYNLTLFETCELLNRSKKSITRYIRRGLLHPQKVKSKQGTLEYRFSRADLEAFRGQEQTRQDRQDETGQKEQEAEETIIIDKEPKAEETKQDRADKTGQDKKEQSGDMITLLHDTVALLKDQLTEKDKQLASLGGKIDQLIERDRETNILLKGLQSRLLLLEAPAEPETIENQPEETRQDTTDGTEETDQTGQDKPEETGQDKTRREGLFTRLLKGIFK